jgi:hypothetical protein
MISEKTITYTKASKTNPSKVLINGSPKVKYPSRRANDHAVFNTMRQKREHVEGQPTYKVTVIQS